MPLISVIIPIYNVRRFIERGLNNVFAQSCQDFEILLSDDGSTDGSYEECQEWALKDSRIRVLHQENKGAGAARNHGIELAQGMFIMFVDADDWLELDACERLSRWIENNSCEILMFSAVKEYADGQKALDYGFQHAHLYSTDDLDIREMLYRRVVGAPNTKQGKLCTVYYSWDKVFRRDFLMENNLRYPVGLPKSEDKVFVCLCFEKMHSMYYIEDVLYHYRILESSACNRYSENTDRDRLVLVDKLKVIVDRMDQELGRLKGDPDYHEMNKELDRFVFGITSDILFLKYYHLEYEGGNRRTEAMRLLSQDPFRGAIRNVSYNDLTKDAKLKKFLLSHGFVGLFCFLKKKTMNYTLQSGE